LDNFVTSIYNTTPDVFAKFSETDEIVRALCTVERLAEVYALSARESLHQGYIGEIAEVVTNSKSSFSKLSKVKRGLLFALRLANRMLNSVALPAVDTTKPTSTPAMAATDLPSQLPDVDMHAILPQSQVDGFSRLHETLTSVYRSVSVVITQFGRIFQRNAFESTPATDAMVDTLVATFADTMDVVLEHVSHSSSKSSLVLWADFVAAVIGEVQSFLLSASVRNGSERSAPSLIIMQSFERCNVFQVIPLLISVAPHRKQRIFNLLDWLVTAQTAIQGTFLLRRPHPQSDR
jgi:hypothetical protein